MVTTRNGSSIHWSEDSYGRAAFPGAAAATRGAPRRPMTRTQSIKRQAATESSSTKEDLPQKKLKGNGIRKAMPPVPKRTLRVNDHRGYPTCSDFGPCRRLLFPNAFFCSNCAWWDEELSLKNTKAFHRGRRFQCHANHMSWICPTDLLVGCEKWRRVSADTQSRKDTKHTSDSCVLDTVVEEDDDETDDKMIEGSKKDDCIVNEKSQEFLLVNFESDNDETDVAETGSRMDSSVESSVLDLEKKLLNAQKRLHVWRQKYLDIQKRIEKLHPSANDAVSFIVDQIKGLGKVVTSKRARRSLAREVATCLIDSAGADPFLDVFREAVLEQSKKWFRRNVFTAERILRAMDMAGGQLSMEGLEVLRTIETDNKKWVRATIIPCSSDIQRCAITVEAYAKSKCPYEHGYLASGGKFVRFCPKQVVKHALESFRLTDAAKQRNVSIAQSFDGANLTKKLCHTTYGIKVTDRQAISPFTNRPIFASAEECSVQSRNHNLPIMIVMRNETKEIVQGFQETMKVVSAFGTDESTLGAEFKPLKMAFNSDLSAGWKIRGIGGAAKRENMPCHCCAILSDDLAAPNNVQCSKFCRELHTEREGWKCYHQPFLSEEYTSTLEDDLNSMQSVIGELLPNMDRLYKETKVHTREDPRYTNNTNTKDPLSIHFDVASVDREERAAYSSVVNQGLELRNLPVTGRLLDRQERLRISMETEYKYRQLRNALHHGRRSEAHAIVKLHETVPCILHMENRAGLKIITMLLLEGLDNALKGNLYEATPSEGGRMRRFFGDIERVCNTTVWGTVNNPTQWQCPRDETKKELGTLCLDNNKTRKLVGQLETLFEFCLVETNHDNARYVLWRDCIPHYRASMEVVRSRSDLNTDEIAGYQREADLFFQRWVQLHGREGVTNYIHMIGSGHICEYLIYWENLYSHSQQGWEAFNSLIKTYYFRRTARGGSGNKGTGTKSRVVPIARWLSRRMMWMCAITYKQMDNWVHAQGTLEVEESEEQFVVGPSIDDDSLV